MFAFAIVFAQKQDTITLSNNPKAKEAVTRWLDETDGEVGTGLPVIVFAGRIQTLLASEAESKRLSIERVSHAIT